MTNVKNKKRYHIQDEERILLQETLDYKDFGFNGLSFAYSFTVTFSYEVSCVSVTDL
jgi:hypothetical protein